MKHNFDIIYVTHDSLLEGIGMSQIVPVVIGLSHKGWNVGVVSFEKNIQAKWLEEKLAESGVQWIKHDFGRKGALGGLGRLIRLTLTLPKARAFHCRGDLAGAACAFRNRRNVLWDVRGLWVDQKLVIGSINNWKPLIWFARNLESISARNASAVTTLTSAVFPVLQKRHPKLTTNHKVIPTCTDLTKFSLSSDLPEIRTLLLSGLYNNYYDLDAMRQFIKEFRRVTNLFVVWCHGHEAEKSKLDVGEDEIKILRQDQMTTEIANSSFGIAICKTGIGDSLAGVMPTKVAEFLAVGRPVVVSEGVGDLDRLLLSTRTGVVLRGDVEKAVQELLVLLNDKDTPRRCRDLADSHFNMEKAICDYDDLFSSLLS
jgi:glycosyltransferase involved in cell wall biosynthesis